jgi:alkylation response protein AidB-like acyl-CoA dehydrogenase
LDLSLSESQQSLKDAARAFLEAECPMDLVRRVEEDGRGYSPEMWQKIAAQGWPGLAVPQPYGGRGGSFLDVCVVYEEMGRALTPGPFMDVVLSAYLVLELGSNAQKQALLPDLASGRQICTVALTEADATYEPEGIACRAESRGDDWLLNGTKLFVTNAQAADKLLVLARTGSSGEQGLSLFIVDRAAAGVSVTPLRTLANDGQCEVVLEDVTVPAAGLLGPRDGAWPAVRRHIARAAALTCVWSVGGAERVLEMTTEYAKTRVQFDRPIGTFQAISHKCADMAIDVDGMRFVAYHAAWSLSEALESGYETAVAKAWCSDAYQRVTASGHQVHGGIGFTKAHDMQMYYRRAKAADLAFGDADYHRERVAQALGL